MMSRGGPSESRRESQISEVRLVSLPYWIRVSATNALWVMKKFNILPDLKPIESIAISSTGVSQPLSQEDASSCSSFLLLQYYLLNFFLEKKPVRNSLYEIYYVLERISRHRLAPTRLKEWSQTLQREVRSALDGNDRKTIKIVFEVEEREEVLTRRTYNTR